MIIGVIISNSGEAKRRCLSKVVAPENGMLKLSRLGSSIWGRSSALLIVFVIRVLAKKKVRYLMKNVASIGLEKVTKIIERKNLSSFRHSGTLLLGNKVASIALNSTAP
jgi:hypothetical protein